MQYFLTIIIGVAAGALELVLLMRLLNAIMTKNGKKAVMLIPAKLLVLAVALAVGVLLAPKLLWIMGLFIIAPLIIGSAVKMIRISKKNGGGDNAGK